MAHAHDAPRGHAHDGRHRHVHAPGAPSRGLAFAIGISLNLAFTAVELVFGLIAQSMALLADAAHNVSDVLGLGLAWGATVLARRRPSSRRTYGLRRTTILAALANAVVLLVVVGGVVWEAIERTRSPTPVAERTMLAVASVGVLVNGASAALFLRGRERDANVRGAFLHLAADAGISLGVVLGALGMMATGWQWIDPVLSLAISIAILSSTFALLMESLELALDAVPPHIDPEAVRRYLEALPGVAEVHDLHIWAMSTTETALTAHLVMRDTARAPAFLGETCAALVDRFRIAHPTLQVESASDPAGCPLAPAGLGCAPSGTC